MSIFGKKDKQYHDTLDIQRKAVFELETIELSELALEGLDCDKLPNHRGEFGKFHRNPILTNGINGTLIYLSKLIIETTKTNLFFHKLGSIPNIITQIGTIDIYETVDENGNNWDILFIDMYHPRRSNIAPKKYSFIEKIDPYETDRNNSYGSYNFCNKFPLGLPSLLISDNNPRYAVVEKMLEKLTRERIELSRPEEHQKKVDLILSMLKTIDSEE